MNTTESTSSIFHNEDAIFRIAMWSNIVAWASLVLALLVFANTAYSITSNWSSVIQSLPPTAFGKVSAFAGLFLDPLKGGVFVFLMLRGLSQALYLAMDFYFQKTAGEEVVEPEAEVAE